jgi:hypothetical protein
MRLSFVGALLAVSLVIGVMTGRSSSEPAYTQMDVPARAGGGELFTQVTAPDGAGPLTATVIDPRQRVFAVYHVDRNTGEITLKSVRNITWDLQMIEFNTGKPIPQDIRSGLPR